MAKCGASRKARLQLLVAVVLTSASVLQCAETAAFPLVPIAEAVRDDNHDYVPDRLGQGLTLEGVITAEPVEIGSAVLTNLQDETGGIVLFTRNKTLLGTIHRGDLVRAEGRLSQHKGAEELTLERIEKLGTRAVPAAREVLAADLNGERYSGQLVRVVGELRRASTSGTRDQFVLRDRSGEIAVSVPERFLRAPEFVNRMMKGGHAAVVGIAGQYCENPPYNSGYRVVIISATDIAFAPVPPYRLMGLGIGVAAMVAGIWAWSRRRRRIQREKAFEQSDAQRRLLEAVLKQMPAGTTVVEADSGRVLFDNEEGRRLCAGQNELFERARTRCLTQDMVCVEEAEVGENGDRRFLRVSSAPIRDHKGRMFAAIVAFYDITDSKRSEAALLEAEKVAATGRMAATMAHEINNPLAAVMNLLFLLRGRCGRDEQYKSYLDAAQAELNRVVHIVNQTLTWYRNSTTPVQVNVAEVVDSLLGAYAGKLEQRRLLVRRRDRGGPYVRAFAVELRQILSNILLNAMDAANSQIHVRVCKSSNWNNPAERGIRVTVADDGPGIPPEHRARIFEPFFTTKAEKGTGLGLWVVQGMVHKHHGSLHIRSSSVAGRSGTVMSVFIPSQTASDVPISISVRSEVKHATLYGKPGRA